jgi:hypothetical protein
MSFMKSALVESFSDKLLASYHYNLLHEATQGKTSRLFSFQIYVIFSA